jgi:hypothetical protein
MPLEMSGEVQLDTSSRYTASTNGRKYEPPPGVPTQSRVAAGSFFCKTKLAEKEPNRG